MTSPGSLRCDRLPLTRTSSRMSGHRRAAFPRVAGQFDAGRDALRLAGLGLVLALEARRPRVGRVCDRHPDPRCRNSASGVSASTARRTWLARTRRSRTRRTAQRPRRRPRRTHAAPQHRRENGPDRVDDTQGGSGRSASERSRRPAQGSSRLGTSGRRHEDVAVSLPCADRLHGGAQLVGSGRQIGSPRRCPNLACTTAQLVRVASQD
jgi:hypothetical protein